MNEEDIVREDGEEAFEGKLKKLRDELKKALAEKQEYLSGWQRARADLINFKKEAGEDKERFARFATEDFIMRLIPVLDSFDMALAHGEEGVEQILKQFQQILKDEGVTWNDPTGEPFDPTAHEAIESVPVRDKEKDDIVLETLQKEYRLNDKVIRPAKVKVGTYKNE